MARERRHGRAVGGVSPQVVLGLFGAFIGRRNPALRVLHCNGSSHEHVAECGGFCADDQMATRAWSLRALTKPLGVSDAAVLRACLSQWQLSAEHTAMFLLNYVGTVWEMWEFIYPQMWYKNNIIISAQTVLLPMS